MSLSSGDTYALQFYLTAASVYRSKLMRIDPDTGALDTSFGTGGALEIPSVFASATQQNWTSEIIVLNDRFLMLCGNENNAGTTQGVLKLFDTQTQALVNSFGTSGAFTYASTDVTRPGSTIDNAIYDSALDRIVVTGRIFSSNFSLHRSFVTRIDRSGNLDPSFNGGTPMLISHAALTDQHETWPSVIVTSSDYLIAGLHRDAAGTYNQGYFFKISKSGAPVNAFGTAGLVLLPPSTAVNGLTTLIQTVKLDQSGNLLIPVTSFNYDSGALLKLNSSTGLADTTFGPGGQFDIRSVLEAEYGVSTSMSIGDVTSASDGSFIIIWEQTIGAVSTTRLTQFKADQTIDRDFGLNGSFTFPVPAGQARASAYELPSAFTGPFILGASCLTASYLGSGCLWKIE